MKKFAIIILVVIMLALAVVPAFAKGGLPAGKGNSAGANTGKGYGKFVNDGHVYFNSVNTGAQIGYSILSPYALSGTISSLDAAAATVTVTTMCGNRLAQPYISQPVTLQTSADTRFLQRNADGSTVAITFEDLVVGQNISSHGTLVEETWTANRVTSGALLNCLP